jgi:hypothetical protein
MNLGHDSCGQAPVLTALFTCAVWQGIQASGDVNPDFGVRAIQLVN